MDSIFDYMINHQISLTIWGFTLMIVIPTLFVLIFFMTTSLAEKIGDIYFQKVQDYKKSGKLNNMLENTVLIISTINIFITVPIGYLSYNAYKDYLTNQITKNEYTVTQIAYDKKTIITDTGEKLQNNSGKIKTVKKPTNDKSKIGQSYYILETYTPEKIKRLFDDNSKDKKKFQTKLIKYTYITDYEQVSKQ